MKVELNEQELDLIVYGLDVLVDSGDKLFDKRVHELKIKFVRLK